MHQTSTVRFYASFQDNIREYTMETDSEEMIRLVRENTRFAAREIASKPEFTIQTLNSRDNVFILRTSLRCTSTKCKNLARLNSNRLFNLLTNIPPSFLSFQIFISTISLYWNKGGKGEKNEFSLLDKIRNAPCSGR